MTRHKRILRNLLGVVLLAIIILTAGIVVLNSNAFHRFVLAKIVEKASQATGGRVEIGDFHFHWSGLSVDLNQVVVHGAERASSAPLLQVDHLLVRLKILSLWRRQIDLREIVIDHPSLHVSVDRNAKTNLPNPPPTASGKPSTNVFDLAIGHFLVNRGELDYNDRHIPLAAEVHDLAAQASFDASKTEYDGQLAYHDGRIQFADFHPVQHSIEARFGATPAGLTISSLKLDAGASSITLQAQLQNYRNPSVDASYQASLSTRELTEITKAAPMAAGQVDLQGTLHYITRADQPLLNNLTMAGQLQSAALALNTPQVHTTVRALRGDYQLARGTLEARNIHAALLGGSMAANLTLKGLNGQPAGRVVAAMHNISIADAGAAVGHSQLKSASISGRLNGTAEGTWVGSGQDLELRSDATITASAPATGANASATNAVPLQGVLHLAYNGPSGVITLTNTQLITPHTTLQLNGSTGRQSSLAMQASSDDLREVDQLTLIARNLGGTGHPPSAKPPAPFGISGIGSFTGQLTGPLADLHLTGQLSGNNVEYQGTTLSALRVNVALSPSSVALSQGTLQTSDQAQVQFSASAGLRNWSYTRQSPISLNLTAAHLPVATLERLTNQHYPVTGTLAARIAVHGTQTNVAGQGTVTLSQAIAWNQPIQNLSVQFQGAGSSISSTLQLTTPAGSASGRLSYDFRSESYDAHISVPSLQLQKLQAVSQVKTPVTGTLTASVQGRGTLKDPQLDATIQASKLVVGRQTLDGLKLVAGVEQHRATVTLATTTQGATIQGRANVNLDANYDATANLDVRNVQLGPLLAAYLPQAPAGLHGQTEMHGTLQGPLKQRDKVQAEVEIPTLNLAYQSLQIGNTSPIRAVYRSNVVTLEPCTLKGTGSELSVQATVPLERAQSLQAKATGSVDLHLIELLYPKWDSSGQIKLDLNADGALAHPNVRGTVQLVNAALQTPDEPLGAENLNATLAFQNGRMDIQTLTGEVGGGTLTAAGFATFQPAVQFNVSLDASRVRLRYPVGTRAVLNGNLLLTGSPDSSLLSGQVAIDRLSLTRDFNLTSFADQFTESAGSSTGPSFAQNMNLNVALNSAREMEVASSQLSLQGSANLVVRGTAAQPVILGRTDITGGELFFNGQRYTVESGVISFVNPVETEPVVNLHVTTNVNQFNITMNFEGPLERMRTTYTSDPPLAPVDIINLVATGQTTEASAQNPSTPQSVIAGQLTNQVSNRVQKLAGISSLTIDPNVGGAQNSGVARIGVQQRVTKNLYFAFTTDLTNSTEQIVQVEYQISKRFAVSTMRDQNGIYTVEVKMHKKF